MSHVGYERQPVASSPIPLTATPTTSGGTQDAFACGGDVYETVICPSYAAATDLHYGNDDGRETLGTLGPVNLLAVLR